ncbi:hypothetical protein GCM10023063_20300 [Arthrobacter methylotrophus]
MGNATAETLYRIAGRKALEGRGWDALNAQLAADSLVISDEMAKTPDALLDLGPLKALELPDTGLSAVARAFRQQLLKGLDSWGIAGTVGAALPPVDLGDAPLDPVEADAFAPGLLAGRQLEAFASAEGMRAARLAVLADRLHAAGDYQAAQRSAHAADQSSVAAHYGAEAAAIGDTRLAALRTGLLLAEDAFGDESVPEGMAEAVRRVRRVHDAANLTNTPIHWEPISFLS